MQPKIPGEPPADLADREPDWHTWPAGIPLWHVASTAGPYSAGFGVMRAHGPLPTARFDPHPLASDHPTERVLYAASDLPTALAERFQRSREVRRNLPEASGVYAWRPTRALYLIDLRELGTVRLGASQLLRTGPKKVTRTWARALRAAWPDADGIAYRSSMAGRDCVALWAPAAATFPPAPEFSRLISDPASAWQALLRSAAVQIGYDYA